MSSLQRPCVLVVDDQPLNIRTLHMMLSPCYQVLMATSGEQALVQCRAHRPDLVLLDVVMPGMDGYAVCEQLKADELTRPIPIIFVTGHDNAQERERGLAAGAAAMVPKPVEPHLLLHLVRGLLGPGTAAAPAL